MLVPCYPVLFHAGFPTVDYPRARFVDFLYCHISHLQFLALKLASMFLDGHICLQARVQ